MQRSQGLSMVASRSKHEEPTQEEIEKVVLGCVSIFMMCGHWAVMSLKSAPNCGQVRGPIQLTFARSVEPVITLEHTITRIAVATKLKPEKTRRRQSHNGTQIYCPLWSLSRTWFVSAHLANQTGFSQKTLISFGKQCRKCLSTIIRRQEVSCARENLLCLNTNCTW